MPIFGYTALSDKGRRLRGHIDATSRAEAKERLREQSVMVIDLFEQTSKRRRRHLRGSQLVTFTQQLAQLLRSSLPLFESLQALEEQYRGEPCHPLIASLADQIKSGRALSQAMEDHPGSFNTLYCSMIHAGEASGSLEHILDKLGQVLAKQQKLKRQLISSLTYPLVIAVFCTFVVILLLTFAIPSIEGLFEDRMLSGFTQAVLSCSHFLSGYPHLYGPVLLSMIVAGFLFFRSKKGTIWRQKLAMRLPLFKKFAVQSSLARFCRTFATLQQGGVNVMDALSLSRNVMNNPILESIMKGAEEKIVEGSSLSHELKGEKVIPRLMVRMVRVGEEAGELNPMLLQVATLYEEETEKTLVRLTSLAQPLILIVMGGIVGLIMLAVLLPLTDVTSIL